MSVLQKVAFSHKCSIVSTHANCFPKQNAAASKICKDAHFVQGWVPPLLVKCEDFFHICGFGCQNEIVIVFAVFAGFVNERKSMGQNFAHDWGPGQLNFFSWRNASRIWRHASTKSFRRTSTTLTLSGKGREDTRSLRTFGRELPNLKKHPLSKYRIQKHAIGWQRTFPPGMEAPGFCEVQVQILLTDFAYAHQCNLRVHLAPYQWWCRISPPPDQMKTYRVGRVKRLGGPNFPWGGRLPIDK